MPTTFSDGASGKAKLVTDQPSSGILETALKNGGYAIPKTEPLISPNSTVQNLINPKRDIINKPTKLPEITVRPGRDPLTFPSDLHTGDKQGLPILTFFFNIVYNVNEFNKNGENTGGTATVTSASKDVKNKYQQQGTGTINTTEAAANMKTAASMQTGMQTVTTSVANGAGTVFGGLVTYAGKGLSAVGASDTGAALENVGSGIKEGMSRTGADIANSFALRSYRRTDWQVDLPMPEKIEANNGAQWEALDADPRLLGLLAEAAKSGSWEGAAKAVGSVMGYEAVKGMGELMGGGVGTTLSKSVIAPFSDQTFKGMDRRQFRFSWLLTPKNKTDYNNLLEIVRLFRYHMHPDVMATQNNESNLFLVFPSSFDMIFNIDGNRIKALPKIGMSILKEFNVDYTPNGQYAYLSEQDFVGNPYSFNISATFEEMVPLTKKDVLNGY